MGYKWFFTSNLRMLSGAALLALLAFTSFYSHYVFSDTITAGTTLTVTITNTPISLTAQTAVFGNLVPGTYRTATTTLNAFTNAAAGSTIALHGDDQGTSDTVMDLDTDASIGLTDQAEWIPASATTSAGNAVAVAALDNSGDVLAFRVMTASGSNVFRAATWWGTDYEPATALWAGIPSSTVARIIAKNSAWASTTQVLTVQYYLDVPSSQVTGAYSGALTYTHTSL